MAGCSGLLAEERESWDVFRAMHRRLRRCCSAKKKRLYYTVPPVSPVNGVIMHRSKVHISQIGVSRTAPPGRPSYNPVLTDLQRPSDMHFARLPDKMTSFGYESVRPSDPEAPKSMHGDCAAAFC